MKRISIIVILIVFNILLIYSKVNSKSDITLSLKENELAIVIINNELSKSLLLLKEDTSILYILDYQNDSNLIKDIEKFTSNLEYVYMNDNYDIDYENKKLIENAIIDNMYFQKNRITYYNYNFCVNSSNNCDFTYLFNNEFISSKNIKTLIYNHNINQNLLDSIEDDWIDKYKISKDNYVIIFIKDDYEITNLIR